MVEVEWRVFPHSFSPLPHLHPHQLPHSGVQQVCMTQCWRQFCPMYTDYPKQLYGVFNASAQSRYIIGRVSRR